MTKENNCYVCQNKSLADFPAGGAVIVCEKHLNSVTAADVQMAKFARQIADLERKMAIIEQQNPPEGCRLNHYPTICPLPHYPSYPTPNTYPGQYPVIVWI